MASGQYGRRSWSRLRKQCRSACSIPQVIGNGRCLRIVFSNGSRAEASSGCRRFRVPAFSACSVRHLMGAQYLEFELPPVVRQHEVGGLIQERSHAPVAAFRDAADVPITHTFGNQLTDARARLVIGPSWQSMSSPVLSFAMRMMRSRGSSIVLIFSPEAQGLRSHRAMDVIGAAAVRMNERGRRLSRRDSPAALAAPASAACWSWLARYRCCRRLWRAPRV